MAIEPIRDNAVSAVDGKKLDSSMFYNTAGSSTGLANARDVLIGRELEPGYTYSISDIALTAYNEKKGGDEVPLSGAYDANNRDQYLKLQTLIVDDKTRRFVEGNTTYVRSDSRRDRAIDLKVKPSEAQARATVSIVQELCLDIQDTNWTDEKYMHQAMEGELRQHALADGIILGSEASGVQINSSKDLAKLLQSVRRENSLTESDTRYEYARTNLEMEHQDAFAAGYVLGNIDRISSEDLRTIASLRIALNSITSKETKSALRRSIQAQLAEASVEQRVGYSLVLGRPSNMTEEESLKFREKEGDLEKMQLLVMKEGVKKSIYENPKTTIIGSNSTPEFRIASNRAEIIRTNVEKLRTVTAQKEASFHFLDQLVARDTLSGRTDPISWDDVAIVVDKMEGAIGLDYYQVIGALKEPNLLTTNQKRLLAMTYLSNQATQSVSRGTSEFMDGVKAVTSLGGLDAKDIVNLHNSTVVAVHGVNSSFVERSTENAPLKMSSIVDIVSKLVTVDRSNLYTPRYEPAGPLKGEKLKVLHEIGTQKDGDIIFWYYPGDKGYTPDFKLSTYRLENQRDPEISDEEVIRKIREDTSRVLGATDEFGDLVTAYATPNYDFSVVVQSGEGSVQAWEKSFPGGLEGMGRYLGIGDITTTAQENAGVVAAKVTDEQGTLANAQMGLRGVHIAFGEVTRILDEVQRMRVEESYDKPKRGFFGGFGKGRGEAKNRPSAELIDILKTQGVPQETIDVISGIDPGTEAGRASIVSAMKKVYESRAEVLIEVVEGLAEEAKLDYTPQVLEKVLDEEEGKVSTVKLITKPTPGVPGTPDKTDILALPAKDSLGTKPLGRMFAATDLPIVVTNRILSQAGVSLTRTLHPLYDSGKQDPRWIPDSAPFEVKDVHEKVMLAFNTLVKQLGEIDFQASRQTVVGTLNEIWQQRTESIRRNADATMGRISESVLDNVFKLMQKQVMDAKAVFDSNT